MRHKQRPSRFFLKKNRQNSSFSESATPSPRLLSPPPRTESPLYSMGKQMSKNEVPAHPFEVFVKTGNSDKCEPLRGGKRMEPSQNAVKLAVAELKNKDGTKLKRDPCRDKESSKVTSSQQAMKDNVKSEVGEGSSNDRWLQLQEQKKLKEQKEKEQAKMQEEKKQKERTVQEKKEKERLKKEKDAEKREKREREAIEKEKKGRERLQKEKEKEQREKREEILQKELKERDKLEMLEIGKRDKWKRETLEKEKKEKEKVEQEKERERIAKAKQEKLQSSTERNKLMTEKRVKGTVQKDRNESIQSEKEQKERLQSEKQQVKERQFLQEQALLLSQTEEKLRRAGDVNSSPLITHEPSLRGATARATYHPSQKLVSRSRKPSIVKRVSSPALPVTRKLSSHAVNEKHAHRGRGALEVRAARHSSCVSSSVTEESNMGQKPLARGSSMPHGHGSEEELMKRVAVCSIAFVF